MSFRKQPLELAYLEVLLRRALAEENVKRDWQMRHAQLQAGYIGERRVDNEWREVNVPGQLLHDFTCRNAFGNSHQMDTIFVCKHFVLVLEIKNVSGRIDFDDARRQFLRTREDGRVESFNNPIDQVKRHRDLLVEASLDWPFYVPVEAFVVIANPSTVIGRLSNEVPVFNVSGLRTKVQELVKKHASISLNVRTVRSYLEAMYEPIDRHFTCNHPIQTGVLCVQCGEVMQHGLKGFICQHCGSRDVEDTALRQAMSDYRVLYGDRISNREFREFVGVESIRTATKMLNRIIPEKIGKNKGTLYIIPTTFKTTGANKTVSKTIMF